jgi:hypothetical protein
MTDTTARLALQQLAASQAQKHVTVNGDLVALDAVINAYILGNGGNTPPGSPADGATYIVGSSPTGAWSGFAGKIAYALDGGWQFFAPFRGMIAWDNANSQVIFCYNGSAWVDLGSVAAFAYLKTKTYTVSTLPSAAGVGAGARAFVTDATATTFLSTVAGGGSNKAPVVSDGANWKIG